MSRSKKRKVPGTRRREKQLHFRQTLPATASPAVMLGEQLRASAEVDDCCICGAPAQFFSVTRYGPEPEVRRLDEPLANGLTHTIFVHRADCPAATDAVEAALAGPTQQGGI